MARARVECGGDRRHLEAIRARRQANQRTANSGVRGAARFFDAAQFAGGMKVLFLNPGGQLGGAERSLLFLMRGIRAARPSCNFELIAGEEGPLIERALELGVRATVMPFPRALARLGA